MFLGLAAVLTLIPGLIHSFLPDGGAETIAKLDLGGRAALVRSVFAWEGARKLTLGVAMLVVAVRYRPLPPLFLSFILLERGLMALQCRVSISPARAVGMATVFLVLSLRPRRA